MKIQASLMLKDIDGKYASYINRPGGMPENLYCKSNITPTPIFVEFEADSEEKVLYQMIRNLIALYTIALHRDEGEKVWMEKIKKYKEEFIDNIYERN